MNFFKFLAKQNFNISRSYRRNFQSFPDYKHLMRKFNETYPDMKNHLLSKIEGNLAKGICDEMLAYQLRAGRQTRSAIALKVHEAMTAGSSSEIETEGFQNIHVIAWISDIVQAAIISADDILDKSEMRRGEIPWYKNRGDFASVDLLVISICPYILLNDWFEKEVFFHSASTLLTKHVLEVATLQLIEEETFQWVEKNNLTWDKYQSYAIMKALYSLNLPFKLAAFESTKLDLQFDDLTNEILKDLSFILQLGNDSESIIPQPKNFKLGKDRDEDIKVKKVNFANTYLLNEATAEDKNVVLENFGKAEPRCVNKIRELYTKYDLPNVLKKYMENCHKSVEEKIEKVSNQHRLRDGLKAAHNCVKLYPESEPGAKNAYPE